MTTFVGKHTYSFDGRSREHDERSRLRGLLPLDDREARGRGLHRRALQRVPAPDGLREGADHVREPEEEQLPARVTGHGRRGVRVHAARRRSGRGWQSEPAGVLHPYVQIEPWADGRVQAVGAS